MNVANAWGTKPSPFLPGNRSRMGGIFGAPLALSGPAQPSPGLGFGPAPEETTHFPAMSPSTMGGGSPPAHPMGAEAINPMLSTGYGGDVAAPPRIKPTFFSKEGAGPKVAMALGEALLAASAGAGNQGAAMQLQNVHRQRELRARGEQEAAQMRGVEQQRLQERGWAIDDRDFKAAQPDYFSAGDDRVKFDPTTGESSVIYDAPLAAEEYASVLGYEPGTPDYATAVQDYTLRAAGPTANDLRTDLEGVRQGNRLQLRGTPTYAQNNPRPRASGGGGGRSGGQYRMLTADEIAQRGLPAGRPYQVGPNNRVTPIGSVPRGGRGGGRSGATQSYTEGQILTNAQGQKVQLKGNKWVPVR